jgi:hypothetical protein
VDGPCHEFFAGPAFARNEDGQIVPLHALEDLVRHTLHGRAGADEARQQRLEGALERATNRFDGPFARRTQVEALTQDGAERPKALPGGCRERPQTVNDGKPWAFRIATERLEGHD